MPGLQLKIKKTKVMTTQEPHKVNNEGIDTVQDLLFQELLLHQSKGRLHPRNQEIDTCMISNEGECKRNDVLQCW